MDLNDYLSDSIVSKLEWNFNDIQTKKDNEVYQLIGDNLSADNLIVSNKKIQYRDLHLKSLLDHKVEGRRFVDLLKNFFCSNNDIRNFINNQLTLKSYLLLALPAILSFLGVSAVNPALLVAIVAVIAYIAKVGYNSYCVLPA